MIKNEELFASMPVGKAVLYILFKKSVTKHTPQQDTEHGQSAALCPSVGTQIDEKE